MLPQSIFYQRVPVEGGKCWRNLEEVRIFVEKGLMQSILVYFPDGRPCVHK